MFKKDNLVIKNFYSTDSPCLDAYIVNTVSNGCELMLSENYEWGIATKCTDSSTWESAWVVGTFYFTPHTVEIRENTFPVCSDQMLTMSYADIAQKKEGE
tara:strand:- start:125 stop:424 length:300 start_codon:yes stop_codon:yes gene_type:complete